LYELLMRDCAIFIVLSNSNTIRFIQWGRFWHNMVDGILKRVSLGQEEVLKAVILPIIEKKSRKHTFVTLCITYILNYMCALFVFKRDTLSEIVTLRLNTMLILRLQKNPSNNDCVLCYPHFFVRDKRGWLRFWILC